MYDVKKITPELIDRVFGEATNELNAFLCEVDFHETFGSEWPEMARRTGAMCRAVAEASTDESSRSSWLMLAENYEATIETNPTSTRD
ncbi:MAG TPA: hypothetical protein VHX60_14425 [Acidobacteriaceae bacterium]|jgi:hypothetical protein|nr:hypothetical protein [Acidobacteriaceae bacterium]